MLAEPLTIAEKALGQISWMMRQRPPWIDPQVSPGGAGAGACRRWCSASGRSACWVRWHWSRLGFTTYVYSRETPPHPRIDLVAAIGAGVCVLPGRVVHRPGGRIGNIDVVYEAVGHSHFALQALRVLGTNGIFVLTGVPGLQAFVEADPARLMRDMVLKNQVLLGTVNAGPEAFARRCATWTVPEPLARGCADAHCRAATRPSRRPG